MKVLQDENSPHKFVGSKDRDGFIPFLSAEDFVCVDFTVDLPTDDEDHLVPDRAIGFSNQLLSPSSASRKEGDPGR